MSSRTVPYWQRQARLGGKGIEKRNFSHQTEQENVGIVILIFHKIDIESKLEEIKKIILGTG